jgi:hypothetical protein
MPITVVMVTCSDVNVESVHLVASELSLQPSNTLNLNPFYTEAITRFEVLTAVIIQVEAFWIVTPCSVVVGYQRFGELCCLHLQTSLHVVTIQKAST